MDVCGKLQLTCTRFIQVSQIKWDIFYFPARAGAWASRGRAVREGLVIPGERKGCVHAAWTLSLFPCLLLHVSWLSAALWVTLRRCFCSCHKTIQHFYQWAIKNTLQQATCAVKEACVGNIWSLLKVCSSSITICHLPPGYWPTLFPKSFHNGRIRKSKQCL